MSNKPTVVIWPWETPKWNSHYANSLKNPFNTIKDFELAISENSQSEEGIIFYSWYFSSYKPKLGNQTPTDGKPAYTIFSEAFFLNELLPFLQKLALKCSQLFSEPVEKQFENLSLSKDEHDGSSPSHSTNDFGDEELCVTSFLPLLLPHQPATVSMTKEQVACITSLAFFGIPFPHPEKYTRIPFPRFDFSELYPSPSFLRMSNSPRHVAAIECLLHYFNRVYQEMPKGRLIVTRQVVTSLPLWSQSVKPISKVKVSAEGSIEDSKETSIHADFANEYIGGGVLGGGLLQEEILFLTNPECLVTLLFCSKMEEGEVVIITGAERFVLHNGYANSFRCVGSFPSELCQNVKLSDGTLLRSIAAMDAKVVTGGFHSQFTINSFHRDLIKAYAAFSPVKVLREKGVGGVATGNWGCGAFGGDKQLKFVQQLLAASEAEQNLYYFTFSDSKMSEMFQTFVNQLEQKNATVGSVYEAFRSLEKDEFKTLLQSIIDKIK